MNTRPMYWYLIAILAVELFLFSIYRSHDVPIHFLLHSLAAATVVFAVASMFVLLGKKHWSLVWMVFLLHQYAMFPDYLYSLGYLHHPWMNLFLGHLWLDDLAYHGVILPAVTLIAVIGYFLARKYRQDQNIVCNEE